MRVLLVYPQFPPTFWSFHYGLPLTGKRALLPPLGLITLAALLPQQWQFRLVDLNIEALSDAQLSWADVVFVSGMRIQAVSMHQVVHRARTLGKRTVVGGPAPTSAPEEYGDADLVFQGEAEGRQQSLIDALAAPPRDRRMLAPAPDQAKPDMALSPCPRFDLLQLKHYASMAVQYSRGCPFNCEFCDIIEMYGRVPRLKNATQMLHELDALFELGFRGPVFFVDDNFIGNRVAVRRWLPQLVAWQRQRNYPFSPYTEASVNLALDETLLQLMVQSGFFAVFLGIETPSAESLALTNKKQNLGIDLKQAVQRITEAGLEVMAGFVLGFDSDGPDVADLQRAFIDDAPIPLAMVGLLMALPQTALHRRLKAEGRLRETAQGDQFSRPNFEPVLDEALLLRGYADLLSAIYTPEAFYRRCEAFISRTGTVAGSTHVSLQDLATLARSVLHIGLRSPHRRLFWRLLSHTLRRAPHAFHRAVALAIMGEHLIRYAYQDVVPRIEQELRDLALARAVDPDRASTGATVAVTAADWSRADLPMPPVRDEPEVNARQPTP